MNNAFSNKETTLDKIDYMVKEWGSNIEYKFTKIRRSYGNIMRTYKSALKGKSLFQHVDRNHRTVSYTHLTLPTILLV